MVSTSQLGGCALGVAAASVIAFIALIIVLLGGNSTTWLAVLGIGIVASGVLGYRLGRRSAISKGPHHEESDPRSWTDDEFLALLERCRQVQADPAYVMYERSGAELPANRAFFGIPMRDKTEMPLLGNAMP
jgi:hypothetical protein